MQRRQQRQMEKRERRGHSQTVHEPSYARDPAADPRCAATACEQKRYVEVPTEVYPTVDERPERFDPGQQVKAPPVLHVVRDFSEHLPFLADPGAPPLICLSDWQYTKPTQRYFWRQVVPQLVDLVGSDGLARAMVIAPGDMASCGNALRGPKSDDVPDHEPFYSVVGPRGCYYYVYGNHDEEVPIHLQGRNRSGAEHLLADGKVISSNWGRRGCWATGEEQDHSLLIGGTHGIPSGKQATGWKKQTRDKFFPSVARVCAETDIVVTHFNPYLPGSGDNPADDDKRMYEVFDRSPAKMLIHGHRHTDRVVVVTDTGKVIVNCDARVIVFMPCPPQRPDGVVPSGAAAAAPAAGADEEASAPEAAAPAAEAAGAAAAAAPRRSPKRKSRLQ